MLAGENLANRHQKTPAATKFPKPVPEQRKRGWTGPNASELREIDHFFRRSDLAKAMWAILPGRAATAAAARLMLSKLEGALSVSLFVHRAGNSERSIRYFAKLVAFVSSAEQLYPKLHYLMGELAMFSGIDAEKPCFGPAEIHVMRRALELAEGALASRRPMPRRALQEHRQQLAISIIRLATTGELDPVVLSAAALDAEPSTLAATPKGSHSQRRRTSRRA